METIVELGNIIINVALVISIVVGSLVIAGWLSGVVNIKVSEKEDDDNIS